MTGGWLSHERQSDGSKLWPGFGQASHRSQKFTQLWWYDRTSLMTQPAVRPVSTHFPRCCPTLCRCCRLASYICSQCESNVTPTQQQGLIYNLGIWRKREFVFWGGFFFLSFPFFYDSVEVKLQPGADRITSDTRERGSLNQPQTHNYHNI